MSSQILCSGREELHSAMLNNIVLGESNRGVDHLNGKAQLVNIHSSEDLVNAGFMDGVSDNRPHSERLPSHTRSNIHHLHFYSHQIFKKNAPYIDTQFVSCKEGVDVS